MNSKKKLINFPKLIRNVWISLWIVLIILLVIKLLFNKWYPIVIENNTLISFSEYIDAHYILKFSLVSILYIIRLDGHLTCIIDGVNYDLWDTSDQVIDIVWKV